ncbi:MAG: hypothetical protein K2N12_02355 [Helicobacter sp.]|nr:hypothetical protein [Helicobacter sp.]
MKKLALCFIAFLSIFSSSAFADDRLYRFSESDMDMIFHRDSAPLELAMLSAHEMQTTEGEWLPFVIGGMIGSGIGNIAYQWTSRQSWSWSSFAGAVIKGAVMGPLGGHIWRTGTTMYRTYRGLPPVVSRPAPIRQAVTTGAIQGITTYGGTMGYNAFRHRYNHR